MSGRGSAIVVAALLVALLAPLSGCGLKTAPQPPAPKESPASR